jgi:mitofilin
MGKMQSLAAVSMMDQLSANSSALRKELESTLLNDLKDLDENALRVRVTQLTAEFMERTRWEGIRLYEAVKQVEDELARKYSDLMLNQRAELELEASKIFVKNQQKHLDDVLEMNQQNMLKFEAKLEAALRQHSAALQETLEKNIESNTNEVTSSFKKEFDAQMSEMQMLHDESLKNSQAVVEGIRSKIIEFTKSIDSLSKSCQASAKLHRESSSLIALENAVNYSVGLGSFVDDLKKDANDDAITLAALGSIPSRVLTHGVPSIQYLQNRFEIVRGEVRKVALAPEILPSVVGHVVGSAIASLSWAPSGLIEGDGPEEVLSRAAYHLDQGNVAGALKELDSIKGYGKTLLKDWESIANDRLVVEQALKIIKSGLILKHTKMA